MCITASKTTLQAHTQKKTHLCSGMEKILCFMSIHQFVIYVNLTAIFGLLESYIRFLAQHLSIYDELKHIRKKKTE